MRTAAGPGEAGSRPEVFQGGRGGGGQALRSIRERRDDRHFGGDRPGVGVVVPVLGVIPGKLADAEPGVGRCGLVVPAEVQRHAGVGERSEEGDITARPPGGELHGAAPPAAHSGAVTPQAVDEDASVGGRRHPVALRCPGPQPRLPHGRGLGDRRIEIALQGQRDDPAEQRHRLIGGYRVAGGEVGHGQGAGQIACRHGCSDAGGVADLVSRPDVVAGKAADQVVTFRAQLARRAVVACRAFGGGDGIQAAADQHRIVDLVGRGQRGGG